MDSPRVNERWGTPSWQPLVVDTRDDFEQTVAGFLRYDVLLVNPIKDGLNLVAKEGPAVNRRDGLLCLSREAGAYEELRSAVIPVCATSFDQADLVFGDMRDCVSQSPALSAIVRIRA